MKPSNVVFFPESGKWKLIDLDGAQKAGERRAVCFTAPYAAPEVLQEFQEEGVLPIAQKASDIWSFGIVAYELLTGNRPAALLVPSSISHVCRGPDVWRRFHA